jgi:asparagine synthetase B (glutamine-hydrolysing)
MCGILAILKLDPALTNYADLRNQALALAKKVGHRGPTGAAFTATSGPLSRTSGSAL